MLRLFGRRIQPKFTKAQFTENKRLLREVDYTIRELDAKDEWWLSAFEPSTGASVDIYLLNSNKFLKVDYSYPVPNTPQQFKLYIVGLFSGSSKGIVRVMLCQLLKRALLKFQDHLNGTTRVYLHACGKGPTGKYRDLVKMYRNMGFEPCGVSDNLVRLQQALENPVKVEDFLFMQPLNCRIYLQQSISKLLGWCLNYYY